jgi:hypothetical protein
MPRVLIAAMQAMLLGCTPVFAQVGGMGSQTPSIGATSPLGMAPSSQVVPTGIPMGATELTSPGVSPAPTGTIGMTGNGTTCPIIGSPSSGISGTNTNYDGGGMGVGTGSSLPGSVATSGMCGTGVSGGTSTSAATSSAPPGGVARTGIPLGSVEIGNAGVSPSTVVPAPSPYPSTMGIGVPCSTTGTLMSSTSC